MRARLMGVGATLAGVLGFAVLRLPLGAASMTVVANAVQLLAAIGAGVGCTVASRRTTAHRRAAWAWLAAGAAAWAVGQGIWTVYEVGLDREVPSPSVADVGFLLFPVASAVGLVLWGGARDRLAARSRDLFDGAIIAGSLLLLSWVATLGPIVANRDGSTLSLLLDLAYPVGDVVLGTLALLAMVRGRAGEQGTLALLGIGLVGLALADSAYLYLTSTSGYTSTSIASSGWIAGFFFVAAAGLSVRRETAPAVREEAVPPRSSAISTGLPYAPLVVAGLVATLYLLDGPDDPAVVLMLGVALVGIVMLRQFLAMLENQRLLTELATTRDQLQHQALHDHLTGLPNRVLLADRLDRALMAPEGSISVLFCDLDDFKVINDRYGHDVGDAFLVDISARLQAGVRLTDTVARLGGDEFAILLEDRAGARGADPEEVAVRLIASVRECREAMGRPVAAAMSIGIAVYDRDDQDSRLGGRVLLGGCRGEVAARLLRSADTAMYAAKAAGKNQAMRADPIVDEGEDPSPARVAVPARPARSRVATADGVMGIAAS